MRVPLVFDSKENTRIAGAKNLAGGGRIEGRRKSRSFPRILTDFKETGVETSRYRVEEVKDPTPGLPE